MNREEFFCNESNDVDEFQYISCDDFKVNEIKNVDAEDFGVSEIQPSSKDTPKEYESNESLSEKELKKQLNSQAEPNLGGGTVAPSGAGGAASGTGAGAAASASTAGASLGTVGSLVVVATVGAGAITGNNILDPGGPPLIPSIGETSNDYGSYDYINSLIRYEHFGDEQAKHIACRFDDKLKPGFEVEIVDEQGNVVGRPDTEVEQRIENVPIDANKFYVNIKKGEEIIDTKEIVLSSEPYHAYCAKPYVVNDYTFTSAAYMDAQINVYAHSEIPTQFNDYKVNLQLLKNGEIFKPSELVKRTDRNGLEYVGYEKINYAPDVDNHLMAMCETLIYLQNNVGNKDTHEFGERLRPVPVEFTDIDINFELRRQQLTIRFNNGEDLFCLPEQGETIQLVVNLNTYLRAITKEEVLSGQPIIINLSNSLNTMNGIKVKVQHIMPYGPLMQKIVFEDRGFNYLTHEMTKTFDVTNLDPVPPTV